MDILSKANLTNLIYPIIATIIGGIVLQLILDRRGGSRPDQTPSERDLETLLERVRNRWLIPHEQSSKGGLELSLKKERLRGLVDSRYELTDETSLDEQPIAGIFKSAEGFLLILGAPGAGKTMTLRELTRALIGRRESAGAQQPVPVKLELASWPGRHKQFIDWLADAIHEKYQIEQWKCAAWLNDNKLILLLDGLDEVEAGQRVACVKAINEFIDQHGTCPGIAVCCRRADYEQLAQAVKLKLVLALYLKPLARAEIYSVLAKPELKLDALRQAVAANKVLEELAEAPLMLDIMSRTYAGRAVVTFDSKEQYSKEDYTREIFAAYMERMFTARGTEEQARQAAKAEQGYNKEQTKNWLYWLANMMNAYSPDVFKIERLQPSWLSSWRAQWLYVILSRVLGSLIIVLLGVLIMLLTQLIYLVPGGQTAGAWKPMGLLGVEQGLWKWIVITGLLGGLTVGILDLIRLTRKDEATPDRQSATVNSTPAKMLSAACYILICGAVFVGAALLFGFGLSRAIYGGLIYGVAYGVFFGFRGRRLSMERDIHIAEKIGWSLTGAFKGIVWGLLGGLVISLAAGLIIGALSGASIGLSLGGVIFLSGCLIGAMVGGFKVTEEEIVTPNQGISRSIKNTRLLWLIVGLTFASLFLIYGSITIGFQRGTLEVALFFGFVVGLLVSFSYCGLDVIYHYTLRLILRCAGHTPLQYARFLDYAYRLVFLHKDGGGYNFIHPEFRKYVAALGDSTKPA